MGTCRGRAHHGARASSARRFGGIVLAVVASVVLAGPAAPALAVTAPAAASDATWSRQAALPSGALAVYGDRARVVPYDANFAAWGLAAQAGRVRDSASLAAAWAHLRWYASAMGTDGYVTDYTVGADGVLTSTGDMDSTDSYAATFLLAVNAAYQASVTVEGKTTAKARLSALTGALDGALRAIESTQTADGLTNAKPTWPVKYLMDQAEVYGGLQAGASLFSTLGDRTRHGRATTDATRVTNGVTELWDPTSRTYSWAVHSDGTRTPTDLGVLYPDALEQVWAVAFGLVPKSRATDLFARIKAAHPELGQPSATAGTAGGPAPVGYWPMAAVAWAQVGDIREANRLLSSIDTAARAAGRPWPYTPGNAGQVLLLTARLGASP